MKKLKTRKAHRCELCRETIQAGTTCLQKDNDEPWMDGYGVSRMPKTYRHQVCEKRRAE